MSRPSAHAFWGVVFLRFEELFIRFYKVLRFHALVCAVVGLFVGAGCRAGAEQVAVIQKQGSMHGFLVLRGENGKMIARGDQIVVARGERVRSRLVFHFLDGSIDDEVTTFRQNGKLALLTDRHIQRGPSFPTPMDLRLDMTKQEVTYVDFKDGKTEEKTEHVDLPRI